MKFCGYCGKELDDSDLFCDRCGKPVIKEEPVTVSLVSHNQEVPQTVQDTIPNVTAGSQKQTRKIKWPIILAAALGASILLGGIAFFSVMLIGKAKTEKPEKPAESADTDFTDETTTEWTSTTASSTETTNPESTTTEEESEEITDETTEETTTSAATSKAKPTAKPIGKTKVTNAFHKKYTSNLSSEKETASFPKVTIEGVSTKAVNNEMYKKCKSLYKNSYGCQYSYYIGKTYVSIIIYLPKDSYHQAFVYNISRKTGKKLSRKQMLKELGVKESTFESKTKKAINSIWKDWKNDGGWKAQYKKAISKKTLKRAIPWVNSKGKLCCLIKDLPVPGGAEVDDIDEVI